MGWLNIFPHLNASLNATGACFLILGFYFIKRKMITQHRVCMLTAFSFSTLFLACYLTYHSLRTYYLGLGPTRFTGEGIIRPIYFTILTTHTILAAIVAPLVLLTLYRAIKGKFESHRKIARIVYPIWLYVSVTGVIVYLMLYQLFPSR